MVGTFWLKPFLFSFPRKFSVSCQVYLYFFMQNPFVSVSFGHFNLSNLIFTCIYLSISEFDQFDYLSLSRRIIKRVESFVESNERPPKYVKPDKNCQLLLDS